MSKGIIALVFAAVAFFMWRVRQQKAKQLLLDIDLGKRCVSCHGMDLTHKDDKARCNQCGYVTDLAFFRAAQVDGDEIANVTKPDSLKRWTR